MARKFIARLRKGFEKEGYRYCHFEAEDRADAIKKTREWYNKLEIKHPNVTLRYFTLEFRATSDREYSHAFYFGSPRKRGYSFKQLEDLEDEQLLLFDLPKQKFCVETRYIDKENGFRTGPCYSYVHAFNIEEAIRMSKIVFFGVSSEGKIYDWDDDVATLQIKLHGRNNKWQMIYDAGIEDYPLGGAIAIKSGKLERSICGWGIAILEMLADEEIRRKGCPELPGLPYVPSFAYS